LIWIRIGIGADLTIKTLFRYSKTHYHIYKVRKTVVPTSNNNLRTNWDNEFKLFSTLSDTQKGLKLSLIQHTNTMQWRDENCEIWLPLLFWTEYFKTEYLIIFIFKYLINYSVFAFRVLLKSYFSFFLLERICLFYDIMKFLI
jgi:hypothetical protein